MWTNKDACQGKGRAAFHARVGFGVCHDDRNDNDNDNDNQQGRQRQGDSGGPLHFQPRALKIFVLCSTFFIITLASTCFISIGQIGMEVVAKLRSVRLKQIPTTKELKIKLRRVAAKLFGHIFEKHSFMVDKEHQTRDRQ